MLKRIGLFIIVGFVASGRLAHAATYYASTSGSDSNSCAQAQSVSTPKRTIKAGISCLSGGGDTLLIRKGTYAESIVNGIPSGTSWSNKVRIANYPGETVWMAPQASAGKVIYFYQTASYIEFDGINLDASPLPWGAFIAVSDAAGNPHHLRLKNAEVIGNSVSGRGAGVIATGEASPSHQGGFEFINLTIHGGNNLDQIGAGSYGIYLASSDSLIDGCEFYDTLKAAIHIYSGAGMLLTNNVVRNNRIHDIHRSDDPRLWGILVTGDNHQIYNNVVYGLGMSGTNASQNSGIYIYTGSGHKVYNNTISGNAVGGIYVGSDALGTEVKNNISYANSGFNFINGGYSTVAANNLFDVDPAFVDASAHNFQLRANSPAVDAGTGLSGVTTDLTGVARPEGSAVDIGAYEYRPAQSSSPPPAPSGLRIVAN